MPEEATEALEETQDTPTDAASVEETPAPESTEDSKPDTTDIEKRYADLRSEFDRRNAALSGQYGPEAQAEALRQFNIELAEAEEEDDDEFIDPDEKLRQEFEALKNEHLTAKQQAEQAQMEEREATYIADQIDALEKKAGIELDDEAVDFVIDSARANRGQDGAPNVEAAFKGFTSVLDSHQERYVQSKTNAAKAPVGGPGEEKFDPSNDDDRLRAMTREFEAAEGSD